MPDLFLNRSQTKGSSPWIFFTTHSTTEHFEQLVKNAHLSVRHMVMHAGDKAPEHVAHCETIIVPLKGEYEFGGGNGAKMQVMRPGMVAHMLPGDAHAMRATQDAEAIVIKLAPQE